MVQEAAWLGLWSQEGSSEQKEALRLLILYLYAAQGLSGTQEEKARLRRALCEIAEIYSKSRPAVSSAARKALLAMSA